MKEDGNPLQYSCLENSKDRGAKDRESYSPWDPKESDTAVQLTFTFMKNESVCHSDVADSLQPHGL